MEPIIVYTDGGCSGNPGPGGWGFAIVRNQNIVHDAAGTSPHTTNNKMELTAIHEALAYIETTYGRSHVILRTDSNYAINSISKWAHGWKKKGWVKSDGKPIENPELIQAIYQLCYRSTLDVEFSKVKAAHDVVGTNLFDPFNDHVDLLATGKRKPGARS